jgi:hypothetical protein
MPKNNDSFVHTPSPLFLRTKIEMNYLTFSCDTRMSIWFCDTSTGSATGAVHCGSFVGGGFGLLVASYGWTWWTWRFTWFGPLEHNTLRPRENWVVLHKSALPEPYLFSGLDQPWPPSVKWRLSEPFIPQGRAVTIRLRVWQLPSRWLKPYTASKVLMASSSKWYLQRCVHVWSCRLPSCCTEHDQRRGAILSDYITTVVMSKSGQLGWCCTIEPHYSGMHILQALR